MRVFDSHLHLQRSTSFQYYDKIPSLLPDFLGIASTNPNDWNDVSILANKFPLQSPSSSTKVVPSYGYHPWWVKEDLGLDITSTSSTTSSSSFSSSPPEWINTLEKILLDNPHSVVGECGLDKITAKNEIKLFKAKLKEEENDNAHVDDCSAFFSSCSTWQGLYSKQKEVFRLQLQLASRMKRPVVVHCVAAYGDLYDILEAEMTLPHAIYMHAYGGSVDFAKRLMKLEKNYKNSKSNNSNSNSEDKKIFYFGFSAAINQSKKLLSVIESIPSDRLLLESDLEEIDHVDGCLKKMLHIMADVRGVTAQDIAETTYQNALNFYNINEY